VYLLGASFFCWLLPFLLRIFFIEIPDIKVEQVEEQSLNSITNVIQLLDENDKNGAFWIIFKNNIKGCVINIAGGVLLGIGTLFNLLFNGFFLADIFVYSYKAGMNISSIMKVTLPHSFELIGFWLSGAIGFYIAWNIIQFMRGKESFSTRFYKQVGIGSVAVVAIILAVAYVEAYISTSILTQ
jgi:uncharacterized membrane protein SpoIIM required for sporulation